jgi:hypothetical protein
MAQNATDELTADEWDEIQNDLRAALDVFERTYGDEDNKNEIVRETESYAVFADGSGHELNEIAQRHGVDRDALSRRMHDEARSRTDHNWSVVDPVVVLKE